MTKMIHWLLGMAIAAILVTGTVSYSTIAFADDDDEDDNSRDKGKKKFRANLNGFEEVPAVSSTGEGKFRAELNKDRGELEYRLEYDSLEGDILQSHIHFAQKGVNGGVSLFLCTNLGNNSDAPACPGTTSGTVHGTLTADNVIGPSGQGIDPGEFDEIIDAMRNGVAYINVHTDKHPPGEIRGQVR